MELNPIPHIPVLDAKYVLPNAIKHSGRSEPIALFCEAPDLSRNGEYVVKLYGSLELGFRSLAKETYGALLGQVLGFKIVQGFFCKLV